MSGTVTFTQCPRCTGRGYLAEKRKPSKRNPTGNLGFYARTCPRCTGTGSLSTTTTTHPRT